MPDSNDLLWSQYTPLLDTITLTLSFQKIQPHKLSSIWSPKIWDLEASAARAADAAVASASVVRCTVSIVMGRTVATIAVGRAAVRIRGAVRRVAVPERNSNSLAQMFFLMCHG